MTSSKSNETGLPLYLFDTSTIEVLIESLFTSASEGFYLYDTSLKVLWKKFKKCLNIEKAAGGLVTNLQNEILVIYRFQKWDLPKGKIENGERKKQAAKREVEEECGVNGLTITKKLIKTYHIFKRAQINTLKITYWYQMTTNYAGKLTPQKEEGIDDVRFIKPADMHLVLRNTYQNIEKVFGSAL